MTHPVRTRWLRTLAVGVLPVLPLPAGVTGPDPGSTAAMARTGHTVATTARTGHTMVTGRAARPGPPAGTAGLPLAFTRNNGQADRAVRYLGQAAGVTVLFTDRGVTLDLVAPGRSGVPGRPGVAAGRPLSVTLGFLGANPRPRITGAGREPGTVSYFTGDARSRWRAGLHTFGRVVYHDLWPGIDAFFSAPDGALNYGFTVAAGASTQEIRLSYSGARSLAVGRSGSLAITTGSTVLHDQAPTAYQLSGHQRRLVATRFRLLGGTSFGLTAGPHAAGLPLTIDPGLRYSTYLGGNHTDASFSIVTDAHGDLYVFGLTASRDFPTTPGVYQPRFRAAGAKPSEALDFFVAKFNPAGTRLIYATYVGTGFEGIPYGVVGAKGDAYLTGETFSRDFPTTPGAYRRAPFPSQIQSVVVKLNRTGSRLVYSTYLAPDLISSGFGANIALGPGGSAIVIGNTTSDFAPTTPGAVQTTYPGGGGQGYVARLNADGSRLIYGTYLGAPVTHQSLAFGPPSCSLFAMAVTPRGAVVAGGFCNQGFPTTQHTIEPRASGFSEGLLVKLSPRGNRIDYATYYGTPRHRDGIIRIDSVALDRHGDVYLTADTPPGDIPATAGAFAANCSPAGATNCAAVAELNPSASRLVYSTYFGGGNQSNWDSPNGLAVDASGRTYVTGDGSGLDIPTTPDAYARTPGDFGEPFFLAVFGKGSLLYASYFGGAQAARCIGAFCGFDTGFITISPQITGRTVYLGGTTSAPNLPVTPHAFQKKNEDLGRFRQSAWAARLVLPPLPPAAPAERRG